MYAEVSAIVSVDNNLFCQRDYRPHPSAPAQIICHSRTRRGPWEHRASVGIVHTRKDEYPGHAWTQAFFGGPTETVQCGEKGGRTDTGKGPEWCPVHQFLDHSHTQSLCRSSRTRGRQRNLGKENRLSPVCHWLRGGPCQCLEIPLLVLQKWRGWVKHAVFPHRCIEMLGRFTKVITVCCLVQTKSLESSVIYFLIWRAFLTRSQVLQLFKKCVETNYSSIVTLDDAINNSFIFSFNWLNSSRCICACI